MVFGSRYVFHTACCDDIQRVCVQVLRGGKAADVGRFPPARRRRLRAEPLTGAAPRRTGLNQGPQREQMACEVSNQPCCCHIQRQASRQEASHALDASSSETRHLFWI